MRVWRPPNPGSRVPGFNYVSPAAGKPTVSGHLLETDLRSVGYTRLPAVNESKLKQYELYEHDIVYMYITGSIFSLVSNSN